MESRKVVTKSNAPEVTTDPWAEPSAPVSDRDFLTVTMKAGSGFDAPWLVFHSNSVEEALASLKHDDLDELMDLAARKGKEFSKVFGGPAVAAPKASGGSGWGGKAKAAASSSEEPSGTCPTHNCDLVKVDGFTKRDGTAVSARVGCPVPKCYAKTFWQNDDGSWTEK